MVAVESQLTFVPRLAFSGAVPHVRGQSVTFLPSVIRPNDLIYALLIC